MKVSELNLGQGNVDVEGTIKEIGEVRTFNKFGRDLRVANAILEDDSGTVKLTLWNDDTIKFKEGDKIRVVNGYVNEFQGEKQLTSGKFGKIEKLEEGDSGQKKLDSDSEKEFKDEEVEDTAESLDDSETDEDVPKKEMLEDEQDEAAEEDEAAEQIEEDEDLGKIEEDY